MYTLGFAQNARDLQLRWLPGTPPMPQIPSGLGLTSALVTLVCFAADGHS